jgi:hypothetical protein
VASFASATLSEHAQDRRQVLRRRQGHRLDRACRRREQLLVELHLREWVEQLAHQPRGRRVIRMRGVLEDARQRSLHNCWTQRLAGRRASLAIDVDHARERMFSLELGQRFLESGIESSRILHRCAQSRRERRIRRDVDEATLTALRRRQACGKLGDDRVSRLRGKLLLEQQVDVGFASARFQLGAQKDVHENQHATRRSQGKAPI